MQYSILDTRAPTPRTTTSTNPWPRCSRRPPPRRRRCPAWGCGRWRLGASMRSTVRPPARGGGRTRRPGGRRESIPRIGDDQPPCGQRPVAPKDPPAGEDPEAPGGSARPAACASTRRPRSSALSRITRPPIRPGWIPLNVTAALPGTSRPIGRRCTKESIEKLLGERPPVAGQNLPDDGRRPGEW